MSLSRDLLSDGYRSGVPHVEHDPPLRSGRLRNSARSCVSNSLSAMRSVRASAPNDAFWQTRAIRSDLTIETLHELATAVLLLRYGQISQRPSRHCIEFRQRIESDFARLTVVKVAPTWLSCARSRGPKVRSPPAPTTPPCPCRYSAADKYGPTCRNKRKTASERPSVSRVGTSPPPTTRARCPSSPTAPTTP